MEPVAFAPGVATMLLLDAFAGAYDVILVSVFILAAPMRGLAVRNA